MSHNHAYLRKTPENSDASYVILSLPEDQAPDMTAQGWQRLSVDQALFLARHPVHLQDPDATAEVAACDCGTCALTRYAEKHPRSVVARRIARNGGGA